MVTRIFRYEIGGWHEKTILEGACCAVEGPLKVQGQAAFAFTREMRQVLFCAQSPTDRGVVIEFTDEAFGCFKAHEICLSVDFSILNKYYCRKAWSVIASLAWQDINEEVTAEPCQNIFMELENQVIEIVIPGLRVHRGQQDHRKQDGKN